MISQGVAFGLLMLLALGYIYWPFWVPGFVFKRWELYQFKRATKRLKRVNDDNERFLNTLQSYDDMDFDFNEVRFLAEIPRFCGHHKMKFIGVTRCWLPEYDLLNFECVNDGCPHKDSVVRTNLWPPRPVQVLRNVRLHSMSLTHEPSIFPGAYIERVPEKQNWPAAHFTVFPDGTIS